VTSWRLPGWLAGGWLAGWLATAWLAGWRLAGWLAGWVGQLLKTLKTLKTLKLFIFKVFQKLPSPLSTQDGRGQGVWMEECVPQAPCEEISGSTCALPLYPCHTSGIVEVRHPVSITRNCARSSPG